MLKSKRCLFRAWELTDFEALKKMYGNDNVCEFLPIKGHLADVQIEKALLGFMKKKPSTLKESSIYAVVFDGEIIGYCGVVYIKEKDKFEIMYGFNEEYWGRGFATESAMVMKDVAKQKGLNEVIAFAAPSNNASNVVLKKIGYTFKEEIDLWDMTLNYYEMRLDD